LNRKPKILICPLDWGIGHATRDVPVIRELLKQGADVVVGADKRPLAFLKKEFPALTFVKFPGYEVQYPSNGNMILKMAASAPGILKKIKEENRHLNKLIDEIKPDAVISDNRFGLSTKRIPSVFITHQIMIKGPSIFEPLLHKINLSYISKYDECWIPDVENGNSLTGDLSHKYPLPDNAFYIGPLSRFANNFDKNEPQFTDKNYKSDILVMLSGPEPQRTILEDIILKQINDTEYNCVILKGKTEEDNKEYDGERIKVFSHLESEELEKYLRNTDLIITRAGHSTIMDIVALGKKAILIPTPGQTEQEYLAKRFLNNGIFYSLPQNKFDLHKAIYEATKFSGIRVVSDGSILKERITVLINRIGR
jgi:UDP:flavonoid glycosyltransferase YjiC (YdhE family)